MNEENVKTKLNTTNTFQLMNSLFILSSFGWNFDHFFKFNKPRLWTRQIYSGTKFLAQRLIIKLFWMERNLILRTHWLRNKISRFSRIFYQEIIILLVYIISIIELFSSQNDFVPSYFLNFSMLITCVKIV